MYKFTTKWFSSSNGEIKNEMFKYFNQNDKISILEIGSYEGASSCFFADNFLNHDESRLVCVDPFDTNDKTTPVFNSTENTFLENISKSINASKIQFKKMYSKEFFINNNDKFDFIYIDGSHVKQDVILDFEESLKIIKPNGIIWMDDYRSSGGKGYMKICIDELFEKYKENLELIHKGYQVGFRCK